MASHNLTSIGVEKSTLAKLNKLKKKLGLHSNDETIVYLLNESKKQENKNG